LSFAQRYSFKTLCEIKTIQNDMWRRILFMVIFEILYKLGKSAYKNVPQLIFYQWGTLNTQYSFCR
jgi:hypothetical protein